MSLDKPHVWAKKLRSSRHPLRLVLMKLREKSARESSSVGDNPVSEQPKETIPKKYPVYCVQRDDKLISISFDAAWGNEDTQTLLDILERYGVRTTFFVVGIWVDRYPESVKALADAGHEVMNHSSRHGHFSQMSGAEITADIIACNDKIAAITGSAPTLFRCPYGEYDNHVIEAVSALGMTAIQWDADSLDWKGISADEIRSRVLGHVQPGSIVLFHNAAANTPEALPGILDALLADGYRIVPVSQLLLKENFYIDYTGRQCRL